MNLNQGGWIKVMKDGITTDFLRTCSIIKASQRDEDSVNITTTQNENPKSGTYTSELVFDGSISEWMETIIKSMKMECDEYAVINLKKKEKRKAP